ncbi:MAG: PhzF family phenazine biosynthesis protein [Elusimicrobia bacterium]|nr:PhzF family phenazine biosynthesis protein [Elusimicrobiota bacterium]
MKRAARVAAFVKDGAGGNMAGVVLDAQDVADEERLEIARALGYSETTFVEGGGKRFKLRYWTPVSEIDLCGHGTIAAFAYMLEKKRVSPGRSVIETKAGTLEIEVSSDGVVFMEQNQPLFGPSIPVEEVAAALGGAKVLEARIVSTGLADLLAEVESRDALLALKPELSRVKELTESNEAVSLHVFALGAAKTTAYCRDFAPGVGIPEEAATGTASGALACHLFERGRAGDEQVFVQGESLGRPSEIIARLGTDGGRIAKVRVGGRARIEPTASPRV